MKLWNSRAHREENGTSSTEDGEKSRVLSFFDLVTIGVGSSLAVGVSVLVGGLAKNLTGPAAVVSIFLAGATALLGGLCFSEFGVRLVQANSAYAYSYYWSKGNAAFVFGWALVLEYVAGTASAAKGIVTFIDALAECEISRFLGNVLGTNFQNVFPYFDFPSLGIIVIFTILISFGLKDSIAVKKILTVCNVVLIVSVITAGAFKVDLKNWRETPDENSEDGFAPFGVLGIVKGTAVALYGFIGFDRVSISGSQVKKQRRNVPAAISLTILITLLAYAGVGVILTLVLPYSKLNPGAAVPFAFQDLGWPGAKWVVAVATFSGFQTGLFGALFPLPRVLHGMANDGLLFPALGNHQNKSKVSAVATLAGGFLAAAGAGIFTFQKLVNLTVMAGLFVYTVLAINVVLLRYSSKCTEDETLSESCKNLVSRNVDVTMKAIIKNYFNYKEKHPTNLTQLITYGNVILFCISTIGLGVIFNVFYESLSRGALEAVVPAGILLSVMLFNFISLSCQPKSQEMIPFKVPLMPVVPCFSMFLNIFLMLTFESLTWILFSVWMAAGILPHTMWRFYKCMKGEMGENSLFEINKINAVKLNESIWKMKSDKKSFYEGAINPVFSEELEERFEEVIDYGEEEIKKRNEKTTLQLKQAEIIQTAEFIAEDKAEPLESGLEINFIRIDSSETVTEPQELGEKVQWECVAEIHTEEEIPQEVVALEIVDNTYNFLTEVSEELSKNADTSKDSPKEIEGYEKKSLSLSEGSENSFKVDSSIDNLPFSQPDSSGPLKSHDGSTSSLHSDNQNSFKEELLQKIEILKNNKNNADHSMKKEYSNGTENTNRTPPKEINTENLVTEFPKNQNNSSPDMKKQKINEKALTEDSLYEQLKNNFQDRPDVKATEPIPDEHNKIKDFKEKLNQLLKNHLNGNATPSENSSLSKPIEADEKREQSEKNSDVLFKNAKTLNKSQIMGKLELLLAKGPPKRPALGASFNIQIKEADKNSQLGRTDNETQNNNNNNVNGSEGINASSKSISESEENIKEKTLPLKNADSEIYQDVFC